MKTAMSFLPAFSTVVHEGAAPTRTALLLHGILGSSKNLRTFARRWVESFPAWRVVLVDLRNHGDSTGATPPHDLAACATDLAHLDATHDLRPELIAGHSFGGKVALVFARDIPNVLRRVCVLDAPPGPIDAPDAQSRREVERVIQAVRAIPLPIAGRDELVAALLAAGLSRAIALWMTTNVRPVQGGFTWRFDLDGVDDMLASFARTDLWPFLETLPPGLEVDIVRGGRSDRWTSDDEARLEALAALGQVHVHLVPEAGHWLHADAPDELLRALSSGLGVPPGDTP